MKFQTPVFISQSNKNITYIQRPTPFITTQFQQRLNSMPPKNHQPFPSNANNKVLIKQPPPTIAINYNSQFLIPTLKAQQINQKNSKVSIHHLGKSGLKQNMIQRVYNKKSEGKNMEMPINKEQILQANKLNMQTSEYVIVDKNMKVIQKKKGDKSDKTMHHNQANILNTSLLQKDDSFQRIKKSLKKSQQTNKQLSKKVSELSFKLDSEEKKNRITQEEIQILKKNHQIELHKLMNAQHLCRLNEMQLEIKAKILQQQVKEKGNQLHRLKKIKRKEANQQN